MPEDAEKKKPVEKKDGGCYTGCVGVYRDAPGRSPVPKDGAIAELLEKLHGKGGVYRDVPAERPEQEIKTRAVYNDGVVTVSADAEGRIVCPRLFFKPREEGKENEDDTVDLSACRNCPEKRWRGYGTNGRRVVMTSDQRTAEEAVLTVDCNYPFEEPEMLEAYQMIMTVLSDVPLEKAKPEKKGGVDLSEVDKLIENYNASD
jgi:hypothetical protein